MGFGCNVPAIMATRTIENRNNRILTMLMNPFMSCSARLPVYILLVGTIFPNHKGTFVFFLYFIGIFFAVSLALLFKYWVFKKADVPFVMELPPYRFPTLRSISKHMWQKAVQYLRKMGGVILAAAIIIWALGYFPVNRTSYLNRIGMFVEPGIRPLGFDWRMGVCLLSGVAAKEIVVSTMGVVFTPDVSAGNSDGTAAAIKNAVHTHGPDKGKPLFTPLATLSFLLFTLLYFPCMATLSAIRYESGSWKWAMLSVFMNTSLAWLTSFVFFRLGTWLFT
jgi:ferrous iron transport protein B